MTHTLSDLIQNGISPLGRVAYRTIVATGGSTTTAIDTRLGLVSPDYRDDDDTLVRGTLIVVSTTDGLAPQGEFQRISSYNETASEITVETAFSAAIGAGDRCMIIHSQFKLEELIMLANQALLELGYLYIVDTSITTSETKQYDVPVTMKRWRPAIIEYQEDANSRRISIGDYEFVPAEAGSTGKIIFAKTPPSGKTLYITYKSKHPEVEAFDDEIREVIPENVAKWGLAVAIMRWTNPSDPSSRDMLNEALRNYAFALQRDPIWKPARKPKFFVA